MQREFFIWTALLYMVLVSPGIAIAQNITTIAGTGNAGYNGDGIAATSAELREPQGLAVDAYGNIYIGDMVNYRIRKIDILTGLISTIAGTGVYGYNGDGITATGAQITYASALAFDVNGDLYFTDRSNNRIRKITMATGMISTVAGTGSAGYNGDGIAATTALLNNPNDISFDVNDNMYIADWFNHRVRKVDKVTGFISTIAGTGTGGYNGDAIAATSAQINGPCGIIFDIYGNIYFAEYTGYRVRKITISTGLISTFAGTGSPGFNADGIPATTAQLNGPAYIRFDCSGNLFIGDGSNQRVRKVDKNTGLISTIAGTGTVGYNGDGIAATTAQLNYPFQVYFDKLNCNTYIGDYYNHRLRKITGGFAGCPTLVAPGNLSSCQVLPAVTINASNFNAWVPVYDSTGKIAIMINANGNNLGTVNTSIYTKTGPCREDAFLRLYLNRNITITPQNQPLSGNVSVRLYILKDELDSLRTAMNSMNQPSGVASINEVDVFKNADNCITIGSNTALPLTATPGTYNSDFYLQVNTSSFSSFYFANKLLPAILPIQILSFTGNRAGAVNVLKWQARCNGAVNFNIERSADGTNFKRIGNIAASYCDLPFYFTDNDPGVSNNYYRLQIIEPTGLKYSPVILLDALKAGPIHVTMQPSFIAASSIQLELATGTNEQIELLILDVTSRVILTRQLTVQAGINNIQVHPSVIAPGIYWLFVIGKEGRSNVVRFIKK